MITSVTAYAKEERRRIRKKNIVAQHPWHCHE